MLLKSRTKQQETEVAQLQKTEYIAREQRDANTGSKRHFPHPRVQANLIVNHKLISRIFPVLRSQALLKESPDTIRN
jgi:hypothetical protein